MEICHRVICFFSPAWARDDLCDWCLSIHDNLFLFLLLESQLPSPKFDSSTFPIGHPLAITFVPKQTNSKTGPDRQKYLARDRAPPVPLPIQNHTDEQPLLSLSLSQPSTTVTARKPQNTPKGRRSLWLSLSQTQT